MERFSYYKDSGIEWLGEIPSTWTINKFSRVSYMKGRIGWQGLKQSEFSDDPGLPYLITGMNFKDGEIRWDEVYHISEERYEEAPEIQLQDHDLLMTKDGTIGKLLYVDKLPGKASLNSHLLVLRPLNGAYHPRYFYYQLQSNYFLHHVENVKTGTTFFGISQEGTGQYKAILPPLPEQEAIASFLDRKTNQIDDLIAKKERLIELKKEERAAIINQAVTKGLDLDVPMKDSGIEWLGEIPEHWNVKPIKTLLKEEKNAIKTGPFGSQLKSSDLKDSGIKVYNQRTVYDEDFSAGDQYVSQEKFQSLESFEVFPDDVLISSRGTIGKCTIAPADIERGVLHPCLIRVQLNQAQVMNRYMWFYINHSSFFLEAVKYYSDATTIEVIYSDTLKNVDLPVPPLPVQFEIIEYLDQTITSSDKDINRIEMQIDLLKEYKTTLISEAVTGKIKVI